MTTLQSLSVTVVSGQFVVGEQISTIALSIPTISTIRTINQTAGTISVDQPIVGSFSSGDQIIGTQSGAIATVVTNTDVHALDLLSLFGSTLPTNFSFSDFISGLNIPSVSADAQSGIDLSSTDNLPDMDATSSSFDRADLIANPSAAAVPSLDATRTNPTNNKSLSGGSVSPDDRNQNNSTNVANEPVDEFNAQYPYNKVYKSESGHIQEVDDTPGHERILTEHKAGTYQEYKPDGNLVTKVVKDNYTIVAGEDFVTIEGRALVHVTGDCQLRVGGFLTITADKGINVSTKGDFRLKARSINMESTSGDITTKSAKNTTITSTEKTNIKSKSNYFDSDELTSATVGQEFVLNAQKISQHSTSDVILAADGETYISSKSDSNIVSQGSVYIQSTGTTNIKSGGQALLSGSSIEMGASVNFNGQTNLQGTDPQGGLVQPINGTGSGSAGSAASATPDTGTAADLSKGSGITFIADPDKVIEATDDDPDAAAAAIKAGIANGTIDPNEINTPAPTGGETDNAPPSGNRTPSLLSPTITNVGSSPPDNLRLSSHFNLGQLSKHAVAAPSAVVAQHGLTVEQIVQNLQLVAENCLEKIRVKYSNVIVTSGFRSSAVQKGTTYGAKGVSQHELGQACDFQIGGASPSDYYAIAQWIKENCPYDQLLLEYKSTGSKKPWIHISFCAAGKGPNGRSNQSQVLTMYNGATAGQGLKNLA